MNDDIYYLKLAYYIALQSPDPSTQNGAIIIASSDSDIALEAGRACNKFPRFIEGKPERLQRPLKYQFMEHAERGAIYNAARFGKKTDGATMYACWAACADCARAIIDAGIERVVTDKRTFDASPAHWQDTIKYAYEMFKESGVKVDFINEHLGCKPVLQNGKLWHP